MKRKHVIVALTVPMAFAACTQEQFDNNAQITTDLSNRPLVGKVTFNEEAANSRLANPETGAMDFSDGDKFGMVLMDEAAISNNSSSDFAANISGRWYTLANKAYTNYPFTKKGNVWTSEAELVEGNYFYYMPYTSNQADDSKTKVSRSGGIEWVIAAEQNAFTKEAPTKLASYNAVKENQLYFGYQQLNADEPETELTAKMVAAHATIGFKLENTEATSITVRRVVLGYNNGSTTFNLKGHLNPGAGLAKANSGIYTDADGEAVSVVANDNLAEVFAKYNNALTTERADFTKNPLVLGGNSADANNFIVPATASTATSSISLNFPANTVLAQGQSVFANMVVPADVQVANLIATVYTDKGIMTLPLTVGGYTTGVEAPSVDLTYPGGDDSNYYGIVGYKTVATDATATVELKQRNTVADKQNEYVSITSGNFTYTRPNEWNVATVKFGATAIQVPGKMDIFTTQDLEDFLTYCKLNPNVSEDGANLTATIKGENVELSKAAYDILKAYENITLNVKCETNAALILPETVGSDAITRISWTNGANVIVKGEQNINAAGSGIDALTITNEGELTVNYVDNNAAETTTVANLYNLGTANFVTPVNATTIVNGATTTSAAYNTVTESAKLTVGADVKATVNNYAQIEVNKNTTITGAISNNEVTNNTNVKTASIIVNEDVTLKTLGDASTNNGIITVNGILTVGGTNLKGFTNAGIIYNNYGIENVAGVKFENEQGGVIKVAADAKFTTVETNNGEIEIAKRTTEIVAKSGNGYLSYTAKAEDLTNGVFTYSDADRFTTIKFNVGDVTLKSTTPATALNVLVTGDATFKFDLKDATGTGATVTTLAGIKVEQGVYMTIASSVTTANLEIETGATIQNNSGCELTINSTITNNGTLRNIGKVIASSISKPTSGNYTGSGEYTWKAS